MKDDRRNSGRMADSTSMSECALQFSPSMIAKRQADLLLERVAHSNGKIAFIENKKPDLEIVAALLSQCERCNQWANRGPLYWALAESYENHMNLSPGLSVVPCANGGIALEILARFHDAKFGRAQRWVGSAFSFSNLGRGWFASMQFIDCDDRGMLDLSALEAIDPSEFDGFVVTNIFGLWRDFTPYIEFARWSGKHMLIDNAAGIDEQSPDWPYQSFSLHHTKPYGVGEGGLIVSPRDEADAIYELLNYGEIGKAPRGQWLNNGKLSDIACAFHLDRLARYPDWGPRYREQAARVSGTASAAGLKPLIPGACDTPATSQPYVAPSLVSIEQIREEMRVTLGKYYKPLMKLPNSMGIFSRIINIPTHQDMRVIADKNLSEVLSRLVAAEHRNRNA